MSGTRGEAAPTLREGGLAGAGKLVRRAFVEFLTLPTTVIAGFVLLGWASCLLDHLDIGWLEATRAFLQRQVLPTPRPPAICWARFPAA